MKCLTRQVYPQALTEIVKCATLSISYPPASVREVNLKNTLSIQMHEISANTWSFIGGCVNLREMHIWSDLYY